MSGGVPLGVEVELPTEAGDEDVEDESSIIITAWRRFAPAVTAGTWSGKDDNVDNNGGDEEATDGNTA